MWIIKIILVALTIAGITALPVVSNEELSKSNIERHNACSLIFNIAKTPDGQQTATTIKMPSLRLSDEEKEMMRNVCNLIFAVKPTTIVADTSSTISPNKVSSTVSPTPLPIPVKPYEEAMGKPIYELQITAWPSDLDDIADAVDEIGVPAYEEQEVIFPEEEAVMAQAAESDEPTVIPLYEDQLVIFPEISFEEEDIGISLDETLDGWPTIPAIEESLKPTVEPVQVVESFHTVHPNGTTEYKLVLSNGLVNYKKIYNKIVAGEVITVQEGYDSIPIPGKAEEFQTLFYIADEHGNNVYKFEHNYRRPELPQFLSYAEQIKMTNKNKN